MMDVESFPVLFSLERIIQRAWFERLCSESTGGLHGVCDEGREKTFH